MIKKQKTTNIKGLEQLYGLDQQPIQEAKLVNTSFNAYVTEISNGNQKLSLANEKFVILTQNHINALISEVNRLKTLSGRQDKQLSKMKSDLAVIDRKMKRNV